VVFHFRAVSKAGPDQTKNYPPESANELAKRCRDHGMSIACIGHPDYSHAPPDCDDYRDVDLRKTVAAICSAHSVAGENSGPMHLANLCGKPTIIWANDQWRVDYSLRWNPFRVPIFVAANDTHRPSSELVFAAIKRALRELSEMTAEFARPCYKLPPRQIVGY
jgi:ADP-heptose:LPS heptosyltransferase